MFLKNKAFIIICLIFFILSEFFILKYLFGYSFVFADDLYLYCKNIKDLFVFPYQRGVYLPLFWGKIFASLIPSYLNIHPSSYKAEYFSSIEAGFFIIFSIIMTNILYLNKKINVFYPFVYVFSAALIFLFIQEQSLLLLYTYDGFFRMLLPPFIMAGMIYFLFRNIYSSKKILFFITAILVFLCGISNEMILISILAGFILYFFINLFSFLIEKQSRNKEISPIINTLKKSQMIKTCIFILLLIMGFVLLLHEGAFTRHSEENFFNTQYIINVIKSFPLFCLNYIKYVFFKHIIGFVLIIAQSIIIFKSLKDKEKEEEAYTEKETIKIIFCFIFGICIFFLSLIGLGEYDYNPTEYWIVHPDLHVMFNILLLAFNLLLLNILIRNKTVKECHINILFVIVSFILINKNFNYYNQNLKDFVIPLKIETYKAEKIMKLASLRKRPAYLSRELFLNNYNWGLFEAVNDRKENVVYTTSPYIEFINNTSKNIKINTQYIFTSEEKAEQVFKRNGGIFTDEELINIDFNKLNDEAFINNKTL